MPHGPLLNGFKDMPEGNNRFWGLFLRNPYYQGFPTLATCGLSIVARGLCTESTASFPTAAYPPRCAHPCKHACSQTNCSTSFLFQVCTCLPLLLQAPARHSFHTASKAAQHRDRPGLHLHSCLSKRECTHSRTGTERPVDMLEAVDRSLWKRPFVHVHEPEW